MELLILAVIFVLFMKNAAANEEKKNNTSSDESWKRLAKEGREAAIKTAKSAVDGAISAKELRRAFGEGSGVKKQKTSRPSAVEIRDRHEARLDAEWEANEEKNRREREASAKRFTAARTKQSNAEQLHTVHVDSCEGRLESLKVLYDAGILDREEYRARVERVKRQHREGRA